MIALVKKYLAEGYEVKIFTARVCDGQPSTRRTIQNWAEKHIGVRLDVTNEKDYNMLRFYDDRAVQVELNTGRIIGS